MLDEMLGTLCSYAIIPSLSLSLLAIILTFPRGGGVSLVVGPGTLSAIGQNNEGLRLGIDQNVDLKAHGRKGGGQKSWKAE